MQCQVLANAIVSASTFVLVGLGFNLIYRTTRFFHFAHGAVLTAGAYLVLLLTSISGGKTWFGIVSCGLVSSVICAGLGITLDATVFRGLRRRGASGLVLLLVSLGLYVVIQNVISLAFGDATRSIRPMAVDEPFVVLGARVTSVQLATVLVGFTLVILVWLVLARTRIGRAVRALANDPELARVSGVAGDRVVLCVFAIGSFLAAVAGILMALDTDMVPTMGMNALLAGVVAVIIGGTRSTLGIAAGALVLGLAQHFGMWYLGSVWRDGITFGVLLVFLLVRPQGVFGGRMGRVAT